MGSNLDAAAKLAIAQAVYKVVGAAVSTKESDNLRAQLDDETVALRVDWDVLTAHERELVIAMVKGVNAAAVLTDTVDTCKDWTAGLVHDGRGNAVDEDGCIVPGVRWVERVKHTTVKGCEPDKVMAALHALPEPVNVMGLLMGGGEE